MNTIRKESLAAQLLAIFYIQKRAIQLTFILIFVAFLAYAILAPNVYRASGSFLFKAKNVERRLNSLEKTDLQAPSITEEDLYTESEILSSNEVLTKTAAKIIAKKLLPIESSSENKQLIIDNLAKNIHAALSVEVVPKSKLIQPVILWSNSKDAAIILNALMWVYLEQRQNIGNPKEATVFLQDQVDLYLTDWKNKKSELLYLTEKYNAPDPNLELTNNLLLKKDYMSEINQLEQKRDNLKADIETLEKMLTDGQNHIYSFMGNNVMASLVNSLQGAQKEKEEAEKVFLPKRAEVKEANELFQNSYKTIRSEALLHLQQQKSTLKTINETLVLLTNKLRNLEHRNIELKKIAVQMEQIQMESGLMASSFEVFYNRRDESQLKGTLEANIAILSHARSEVAPVKPQRQKVVFWGLLLAITLSLTIAFMLNKMDQTIRIPRDVENLFCNPVIFSIEDICENKNDNSAKNLSYFVVLLLIVLLLIYLINLFVTRANISVPNLSTVKQQLLKKTAQ